MSLQTVWFEGSDCSQAQKGINGGKLAKRSVILTFPKLPLPSTMRKLKSEARITSFLPMLCGTSLSDTSSGFFVIDVFYNHKAAQCYHPPQALKHDYMEGKNTWSLPVNRYKNIKQCVFKSKKVKKSKKKKKAVNTLANLILPTQSTNINLIQIFQIFKIIT